MKSVEDHWKLLENGLLDLTGLRGPQRNNEWLCPPEHKHLPEDNVDTFIDFITPHSHHL